MADIFSRNSTYQGSFSAENTRLTFQGVDVGLLVQSVDVSYMQQISRLYELGSSDVYFVAGRTQGGASFQKVIGPLTLTQQFYGNFGDVCNMANNNIQLNATMSCGDEAARETSIWLNNCVINQFGFGVRAETALIVETTQLVFNQLSFSSTG